MCKGWIFDPVRTTQNKTVRNCSRLRIYNVVNITLLTAQNTCALLVGLVEGFPCVDTMVETMCCEACLYVSLLIFFLHPFSVDHCIGNVEACLYRVPFPL